MVNLLHEQVSKKFDETWLRDISMQFFEVVNKVCLHMRKTNLCVHLGFASTFFATDEEATVKIILIFEVMRKSTA